MNRGDPAAVLFDHAGALRTKPGRIAAKQRNALRGETRLMATPLISVAQYRVFSGAIIGRW